MYEIPRFLYEMGELRILGCDEKWQKCDYFCDGSRQNRANFGEVFARFWQEFLYVRCVQRRV